MKQNWLNENLCSFDEKVRIELGPQIIELECNDANLSNSVTHPQYHDGGIDAYGRVIRPAKSENTGPRSLDDMYDELEKPIAKRGLVNEGELMACVDWRAKHLPYVWKIYQWQDTGFVQVDQHEDKEAAIAAAETLARGMN